MFVQSNLKYLMKKHGLNPTSLSARTKIPQASIFRIVEGESKDPKTATLSPLAAHFGITVADLRHKNLETDFAEATVSLSAVQRDWLALLDYLGAEDIDEFKKLIQERQRRNSTLLKEFGLCECGSREIS